jgi:hypothetical protein
LPRLGLKLGDKDFKEKEKEVEEELRKEEQIENRIKEMKKERNRGRKQQRGRPGRKRIKLTEENQENSAKNALPEPPEISIAEKRKRCESVVGEKNTLRPQNKQTKIGEFFSKKTDQKTNTPHRLVAGGEDALVGPAPIKCNINLGRAQGQGSGENTLPGGKVLMTTSLTELPNNEKKTNNPGKENKDNPLEAKNFLSDGKDHPVHRENDHTVEMPAEQIIEVPNIPKPDVRQVSLESFKFRRLESNYEKTKEAMKNKKTKENL